VAFALVASHVATLPGLIGFSSEPASSRPDFWWSLASGSVGLGTGLVGLRCALRGRGFGLGAGAALALAWVALNPFLFFCWFRELWFFALLIAPGQALSVLGVLLCAAEHVRSRDRARTERALRRFEGERR